MKLHGSHKINSFDQSYSDNSFKTTSLLKKNYEWWGHHSNKGGVVVMIIICAHVPMSLRARTSVPDDRSEIKVTGKVWFWQFRDADWDSGWRADLIRGAVGLLLVTPENCKSFLTLVWGSSGIPSMCVSVCLSVCHFCRSVGQFGCHWNLWTLSIVRSESRVETSVVSRTRVQPIWFDTRHKFGFGAGYRSIPSANVKVRLEWTVKVTSSTVLLWEETTNEKTDYERERERQNSWNQVRWEEGSVLRLSKTEILW